MIRRTGVLGGLALAPALVVALVPAVGSAQSPAGVSYIRANQVGYLPESPKVAIVCSLEPRELASFRVVDEGGRVRGSRARPAGSSMVRSPRPSSAT